ncbi:MAG: prepilin peptidase [Spirochaetia bacterium]
MEVWIEFVVFLLVAIPVTFIDIRHYRIPNYLSLGGVVVFVALKILWREQAIPTVVTELVVGFGVFWLIWRFTKGQIGLGDAKYSAFIAVAAGLSAWLISLFVASVIGLLCAAVLIVFFKVDRHARIPFAPFLTAGAILAILAEDFYGWRLVI